MTLAKHGSRMITVKLATECRNNPIKHYKMTARPRGPCLIINNIDFEGEMFPTRKGSDVDASRFNEIFQQLGFIVIMKRNQTADQMRQLFKDVAAQCRKEHDALFVFILSHGSENGIIYGIDGLEVHLDSEVVPSFDTRNCEAMLGKPKVFVIQACRGRAMCYGIDGDATDSITLSVVGPSVETFSQENRVPASWLTSYQPYNEKKTKQPLSDMLLVFSCLPDYGSVRNDLSGSWLGVALAYFIMTEAHEESFDDIIYSVTRDISRRESPIGVVQTTERRMLGWEKKLYFNPGIYL